MKVVCINWGTKYSPEYVFRLFNMVSRHSENSLEFFCLTDQPELYVEPIKPIFLKGELKGWWNKMLLFRDGILPDGEYIYFDLDVVIVDNIDCFLAHKGFGIVRDFIRPFNGLMGGAEFNSSVMKFTQDPELWNFFHNNMQFWSEAEKKVSFFGDQNVISSYLNQRGFDSPFPDEWTWSYKAGVKRGSARVGKNLGTHIPNGGKVCVFHGNPNPHQVSEKWVKDNWI
jgi:hypothetical protein